MMNNEARAFTAEGAESAERTLGMKNFILCGLCVLCGEPLFAVAPF
jgi:hypothetical protein